MLGELDSVKLDSLKKLPDQIKIDRMRRVMKYKLGFNKFPQILFCIFKMRLTF